MSATDSIPEFGVHLKLEGAALCKNNVTTRDYRAEYQRRIARGVSRGFSRSQARGHARKSKGEITVSAVVRATAREVEQKKLDKVVAGLRRGKALPKAIRDAGLSPRQFERANARLFYVTGGRRGVPAEIRELELALPSAQGDRLSGRFSGRDLSVISKYRIALAKALNTGDFRDLQKFKGASVTDQYGHRIRLITSKRTLGAIKRADGDGRFMEGFGDAGTEAVRRSNMEKYAYAA